MKYIFTFLIFLFCAQGFTTPIKTVRYIQDEILNVNTALGIATIIQLPETIQSIIIGDQSGFKVEYLDKAVTIKPLRWGAKTNLFLITEKGRYNLRLHTERQEQAEFIIYVDTTKEEERVTWRSWNKKVQADGWIFEVLKIGKSKNGFFILTGKIHCRECRSIKPENLWVFQESKSKVINGLYLSKLIPTTKDPVEFGISLASADLKEKKPLQLQFKGELTLSMDIPAEVLWK